ncbi:MAG: LysR family transcriptional regulator [Rhodocyclaceae bacterium]|nr:MAG: LysR family transcriptional regulator [Rhodocyclaceae bacterium]TND02570.1 MAG: LysR family transcriptional regulator [Rhodocyclaceae bacterium]
MMTLSQLRTFRTVARLNSFSRAAEELHLTQPAVSAQIVAMENALKIKVFHRRGKIITLTEPGRTALSCAEDIHLRIGQMQRELEDLGELNAGSLHIGASLIVGVYLLPEVLARFQEKYPLVELAVKVEPAWHIVNLILRNELDVGIIGEGTPVTDERLAVKPILRDELIVIVPPNHPLAEAGSISPAELAGMPFVLPAKTSASGECIQEKLAAEGITLHSVMELGNVGAVKRAVEAGMGVSIVSRYAVLRELQDGRLKSLSVSGIKLERQLSLCWHHGKPFSKLTTAFIHFIQKHMNDRAIASNSLKAQEVSAI